MERKNPALNSEAADDLAVGDAYRGVENPALLSDDRIGAATDWLARTA